MPSKAYMRFQKNSVQVEKFKEAYEEALHKDHRRGKRNLDHFTRAAIMFLCSTFEVYFEEVLKESCSIVTKSLNHPGDLPKQVKKTIAKSIKESKNELECITWADNWKEYYINLVNSEMDRLNTPKMCNITRYISKYLGLNNIFDCNAFPFSGIDDVITERGSIAHKVYGSSYIKEVKLIEYIDTISNAVKEIELTQYKELPKIIHKKPWNNTY